MPSAEPSLSVVIPAYNAAKTLEVTVLSARACNPLEVIVVDDGSTDRTAAIAATLGCVVVSQANAGAAQARRRGVDHANGSFVVLLDADDELVSGGVAKSIELMISSPEYGIALGGTIGVVGAEKHRQLPFWTEGMTTESLLARGYSPAPPASFVWTAPVLRAVLYDEPRGVWPQFAEDYELLLRGSLVSRVVTHSVPSSRYRWHGGRSSKFPLSDVQDADLVRVYYGRHIGLDLRPRGRLPLISSAWMRTASGQSGVPRLATLIFASVLYPPNMAHRVARKLRSSLKSGKTLIADRAE